MKDKTDIYEQKMAAMSPEDRAAVERGERIAATMLYAGAMAVDGKLSGPDTLNAIGNMITFTFGQIAQTTGVTRAMEEFEHFMAYQRIHMGEVMALHAKEDSPS